MYVYLDFQVALHIYTYLDYIYISVEFGCFKSVGLSFYSGWHYYVPSNDGTSSKEADYGRILSL